MLRGLVSDNIVDVFFDAFAFEVAADPEADGAWVHLKIARDLGLGDAALDQTNLDLCAAIECSCHENILPKYPAKK
jgi:hypothetical protein